MNVASAKNGAYEVPVLESDRLILRGWTLDDTGPMAEFYADKPLSRFVDRPGDAGKAWRRCAIEAGHWVLRGYGAWVLEEKASGDMIGWAGLWHPGDWPELEIGWTLFRPFYGKGYATEAARRARDHVYGEMGRTTLVSYIALDNAPSQRVAERLGATFEKTIDLKGNAAEAWLHPGADQLKHFSTQ